MIDVFNSSVLQPLTCSAVYIGISLAAIGAGVRIWRWGFDL